MMFVSKSKRVLSLSIGILIVATIALPVRAQTSPEEVQKAIERGVEWIYSKQKDGHWERTLTPGGSSYSTDGAQFTGLTALATYTLLSTGANTRDPRIEQAVSFLRKNGTQGVYALGVRCQLWSMLASSGEIKTVAQRDVGLLSQSQHNAGEGMGLHGYIVQDVDWYDHSASQYAALGIWAAANSSLDVGGSSKYWTAAERGWRAHQSANGGWAYKFEPGKESMTMTAAGVGTLYMAQEILRGSEGGMCNGNLTDEAIERGIDWMGKNFESAITSQDHDQFHLRYYALYGMERIGMASGRRYFGKLDWYQYGAAAIVKDQGKLGGWSDVVDSCFAILFLVHGRQPVAFNKLQYELPNVVPTTAQTKAAAAAKEKFDANKPDAAANPDIKMSLTNWNQRSRDAANLTRWIGKQTERELNWQVVHLGVPIDELHDSQILYLAGNQALEFSNEEIGKLRQFIEEGGMVLGNSDCGSDVFTASFKEVGKKLFPTYSFRELPVNHPIYTEMQFPRTKWKNPPSILGLSNGARELMILIPLADPARAWQTQQYGGKEELMQVGSNIFLYSAERQNLRYKGDTHIVRRDDSVTPKLMLKIARLKYDGNWDPEPGAWKRLANVMHNQEGADLQVETITPGEGKLDKSFKLAALTGTDKFKLSEKARAELRKFLEDGGKLVVDACGGSTDFAAAAEAELSAIVPGVKAPFTALPKAHPAFKKVDEVLLRKYAAKRVGKGSPPLPRGIEKGRRIGIFYSPLDITVGLVGNPIDGIAGYDPEVATQIMSGIIAYSAR